MNEQEFKEMLAYGREQSGVEFKGSGSRTGNKQLFAKVIRAVLSMANHRNGGLVIIGIEEGSDGTLLAKGLSDADLATWNVYDDLAEGISRYADPHVNFDLQVLLFEGSKFVIIRIFEFDNIPVLCKKDYPDVLREGACYVRTRRKPETAEIPTQTEMRDLLELATVKALRRYISVAHTAGFELTELSKQDDSQFYKKQLGDLLED